MVSVRSAIESLYRDSADIYVVEKKVNPETKRTESEYKLIHSEVPCKLSIKTSYITDNSETVSTSQQSITLFLSPDIVVPSGSRFLIRHFGRDMKFEQSGLPAVYPDHQEIILLYDEWA